MRTSVRLEVVFCLLLALWFLPLSAQQHEQTNAGTDFWVTSVHQLGSAVDEQQFYDIDNIEPLYAYIYTQLTQPNTYNVQDTATIQIVGLENCSGFVNNPATGWTENFQVVPGAVTEIKVPAAEILCFPTSGIHQKGVHIHTERDVWAYLISNQNEVAANPIGNANDFYRSFSKFQLIPLQVYDCEYFVPDYIEFCAISDGSPCLLSYFIVATEDSTQVFIPEHYECHGISHFNEYFQFENEVLIPAQTHLLNTGEVLAISGVAPDEVLSNYSYMPVQTNCKPVAVYYYLFDALRYTSSFCFYNPSSAGHDFMFVADYYDFMMFSPLSPENIEWTTSSYTDVANGNVENGGLTVWVHNSMSWPYPYPVHFFSMNKILPVSTLFLEPHMYFQSGIFASIPSILPYPPVDRKVREVVIPTLRDANTEYVQATLTITVPPEGVTTTYVNGVLVPPDFFQSDAVCNDRYFAAVIEYENDEIPSLFHITNPFGFSANLEEGAFASINDVKAKYFSVSGGGSGCTYTDNLYSNDTVTACIGDILHLETHLDYGAHAPICWVVNGTEYRQDELFLPIEVADTLVVLMIEEKFCHPDTSRTIVLTPGIPHISLPADTIICRGASITAQSDMPGFWRWSDGTTSATFTPQTEGDYTVSISNECGFRSATIHVRFYDDPLYVDFGNDTLLCELATLLLDATQQHPASYLWQDASTNTTYTVISDGRYWVVVTDGCTGTSDTIDVTYFQDLQISLGPDTTVCSSKPYLLDVATPYCHYLWHDGTTAPTHWVDVPGTYSVHVYNVCTEADASVTVEVEECEEAVHVPNAFTPDGDGQNEVFLPVFNHPERVESYSLQVYDRWGRQLFSTENPYEGWDGRGCPTGTYVWRMEYKAAGEKPQLLTGSVTVVR